MAITSRRSNGCRSRITSQGQITVPKLVRDHLKIRPGDELEFEPHEDGFMVRHRPRRSILEFAGIASASARSVPDTAEELDALIEKGMSAQAVARDARVRRAARRS